MDYKEKYEHALKKAKAYDSVREKIAIRFGSNVAKEIFSEYEESEDEKMKREILELVSISGNGNQYEEIKDWLEKQGEHKSACQLDNSRSNVSFPFKAKVKSIGKIVTIYDGQLSSDGKEWIKYQSDRKDGYKVYEPDNLELVCEIEQNPAWSEEDEKNYNTILRIMRDSDVSAQSAIRLASWLKLNILQSKQEWSEEDEKRIESAIEHLENSISDTPSLLRPYVRKDIDWLKSLKERMI